MELRLVSEATVFVVGGGDGGGGMVFFVVLVAGRCFRFGACRLSLGVLRMRWASIDTRVSKVNRSPLVSMAIPARLHTADCIPYSIPYSRQAGVVVSWLVGWFILTGATLTLPNTPSTRRVQLCVISQVSLDEY